MKVLEGHKSDPIKNVIQDSIDEESVVFTDKANTYPDIADHVEIHISEKSTKETTATTLKWLHIAIANAKRNLLGVYHKINGKYLQLYLDEFCWKLNRRYFGDRLFDRPVMAVAKSYW
jgi:transposase-like protein